MSKIESNNDGHRPACVTLVHGRLIHHHLSQPTAHAEQHLATPVRSPVTADRTTPVSTRQSPESNGAFARLCVTTIPHLDDNETMTNWTNGDGHTLVADKQQELKRDSNNTDLPHQATYGVPLLGG